MKTETIKDGVKNRLVSIVNNALSTIDFAQTLLQMAYL